jgi:hypothetical protein
VTNQKGGRGESPELASGDLVRDLLLVKRIERAAKWIDRKLIPVLVLAILGYWVLVVLAAIVKH